PRPAVCQFNSRLHSRALDPALVEGVQACARAHGVTPYVVLLAAFDVVLAHWSGRTDAVVGTRVSGRDQVELEPLLGYFVNSVVMATSWDPAETVAGLLRRVHGDATAAFAHARAPFHQVVGRLNPERRPDRHPCYQIAFQLGSVPEPLHLANADVREIGHELRRRSLVGTEFDLLADV